MKTALRVVELDVPVEVVAPAFWRVADADRNANRGHRLRTLWPAHEVHPCFFRRAAALGDRYDVIEGQFSCRALTAAILADVSVTVVDVGAREWDVVESSFDFDIAQQADDRRQLETERHRPDFTIVNRDNLDLPLAEKGDRFLPMNNLERFVGGVEEERLLHTVLFCTTCHRPVKVVPSRKASVRIGLTRLRV